MALVMKLTHDETGESIGSLIPGERTYQAKGMFTLEQLDGIRPDLIPSDALWWRWAGREVHAVLATTEARFSGVDWNRRCLCADLADELFGREGHY